MNKKIFLLIPVLLIVFFGCSNDDEPIGEPVVYEKVPILSTNLPEEFTPNQTFRLRLTYVRPTRCHQLLEVQTEELKKEFYVSIVTAHGKNQECTPEDLTGSTTIELVPQPEKFYIFNFWQGRNDQGEDVYLTVEVPVKSNST